MLDDYKKIVDISLPLDENTIIYPGNNPITIENYHSSSGLTYLSNISFGSHTGTHIDAPRHVDEKGAGVDQIDLKRLVGKCRVLDFTTSTESISVFDLESQNIQNEERILAKTKNSLRGFKTAFDDYVYLSSEGAAYLAEKNTLVFGIDYLSVKKKGSTDNRPHTELLNKGIPIIEGINLSLVSEGEYILIALPLRFTGLDGSPIRAILISV